MNLFVLVTAFAVFDAIADSVAQGRLHLDPPWAVAWTVALLGFVTVRMLKKNTRLLRVAGRDW